MNPHTINRELLWLLGLQVAPFILWTDRFALLGTQQHPRRFGDPGSKTPSPNQDAHTLDLMFNTERFSSIFVPIWNGLDHEIEIREHGQHQTTLRTSAGQGDIYQIEGKIFLKYLIRFPETTIGSLFVEQFVQLRGDQNYDFKENFDVGSSRLRSDGEKVTLKSGINLHEHSSPKSWSGQISGLHYTMLAGDDFELTRTRIGSLSITGSQSSLNFEFHSIPLNLIL